MPFSWVRCTCICLYIHALHLSHLVIPLPMTLLLYSLPHLRFQLHLHTIPSGQISSSWLATLYMYMYTILKMDGFRDLACLVTYIHNMHTVHRTVWIYMYTCILYNHILFSTTDLCESIANMYKHKK